MDDHDYKNLSFLLQAPVHVLRDWYHSASKDDILYAAELLDAYQEELNELTIQDSGYQEAKEVLKQFSIY